MHIPVPEAIQRIANSGDRALAWHFFVMFSRTEYALKRSTRYLQAGSSDAQANWDRFGSDHNAAFTPASSVQLKQAVRYFLEQPPRKQLRLNGGMAWSNPQKRDGHEPILIWLLRMIRCVRNNLFHGGKFPLIPIPEPSRDRELLLNSLIILAAVLPLDEEVQRYFFEDLEK